MNSLIPGDVDFSQGKIWSLVYYSGEEMNRFLKHAHTIFHNTSTLEGDVFPSLEKLEQDIMSMAADMLQGDDACGNVTTGGTESILLGLLASREHFRKNRPEIKTPEMILPISAHPAFEKAAHYFDVKPVHVPILDDFRADVEATRQAITDNTILIVGSAPSYPQGVIDPIEDLARLASEREIFFHVDACVGGFFLPFLRKSGRDVPPFDFIVPGVTSISADIHKYGFSSRGISTILFRNHDIHQNLMFQFDDWPGSTYVSSTLTGSREGGPVATAWAILNLLGEEDYIRTARGLMETVDRLVREINAIDGLKVLGQPDMSVLAFASDSFDIYILGDEMSLRGWHLERLQYPPGLHLVVTPTHQDAADLFLKDLRECTEIMRNTRIQDFLTGIQVELVDMIMNFLPRSVVNVLSSLASLLTGTEGGNIPERTAAMYGMIGRMPYRENVNDFIEEFLDKQTRID